MKRLILTLCLLAWALPAWAATYTIGANASDDYTTWTLLQVAGAETAGDTVSFRRGETFRETITVPDSGTSGNVITYTSHGTGAAPKISGADIVSGFTGPDGNGEYYKALATQCKVVLIDGARIDVGTQGSLTATEWAWANVAAEDRLYLGFNPSGSVVEAGQRSSPMTIDGKDYITITGLAVYGGNDRIDATASGGGICIYGDSDYIYIGPKVTVFGCHFSPIGVGGTTASNIYIDGVDVSDSVGSGIRFANGVTAASVKNSTIHHIANLQSDDNRGGDAGGIEVAGATNACGDISIEDNDIHDIANWDSVPAQATDAGVSVYESTTVNIKRCLINNCNGGGIYYRSAAGAKPSSGTVENCIIWGNCQNDQKASAKKNGIWLQGVATSTVTVNIYNCTFYDNEVEANSAHIALLAYSTVIAQNNICDTPTGTTAKQVAVAASNTSYTGSNQDYYGLNEWRFEGTDYSSLATWQAASGESSSLNADPAFINASAGTARGFTPKNPDLRKGATGGLIPKKDIFDIIYGGIGAVNDTRKLTILED